MTLLLVGCIVLIVALAWDNRHHDHIWGGRRMTDYLRAEERVLEASNALALRELELNQEYLLHVAAGKQTWQAQKMAEISHGRAVTLARAEYEISLARLRRGG